MKRLELYTRPNCSDCQATKAFLGKHNIPFTDYDLSKELSKETALKRIAGTKMVPTFVFRDQSFLALCENQKY